MTLIDEYDTPSLRSLIGRLMSTARTVDIALRHLRLAGLNVEPGEFTAVEGLRLLVGRFDANQVLAVEQSQVLQTFAESGRLEMRTAPHHEWTPDFSIFRDLPDSPDVLLFGAHYFERPYPLFGLALTYVVTDPADLRKCAARFERLWDAGYDVLPAIVHALRSH